MAKDIMQKLVIKRKLINLYNIWQVMKMNNILETWDWINSANDIDVLLCWLSCL